MLCARSNDPLLRNDYTYQLDDTALQISAVYGCRNYDFRSMSMISTSTSRVFPPRLTCSLIVYDQCSICSS